MADDKGDAPEAKGDERKADAKRSIAFADDGAARARAPAEAKDALSAERAAHDAAAAEGLFTVHLTRAAGGHFGIWLVKREGRIVVARLDKHLSGEYVGVTIGDILRKARAPTRASRARRRGRERAPSLLLTRARARARTTSGRRARHPRHGLQRRDRADTLESRAEGDHAHLRARDEVRRLRRLGVAACVCVCVPVLV